MSDYRECSSRTDCDDARDRLSAAEARVDELEAENANMRRERDELRDILHGIGRQADAAARRPAADLIADAEAKARDR